MTVVYLISIKRHKRSYDSNCLYTRLISDYYFFRWEKQEGDRIDEGDSIALIETDKASMALEYQDEGMLFIIAFDLLVFYLK